MGDGAKKENQMMMKMFALAALAVLASPVLAADYVQGHTRKDGTYVAPHYRSDANQTKTDNWSSKGNQNPYTGERGSVDPYKAYPYNGQNQGHQSGGLGQNCGYTTSGQYVCR
jgi:opacity protein-like surface antigen